jgi:prepilin-type N-terminal cleavage/methylation domain-containing protein
MKRHTLGSAQSLLHSCPCGRLASPQRGYTLIELLIVVAVMGLAGALLVPVLGDRGDFDVQGATRRLVADMTFAQSDALANQEHRRLVFLPDPEEEGQFIGWAIVELRESELGFEFDPDTATYVNDPLAPAGQVGSYIVNLKDDERFGDAVIASVDIDSGSTFITYDELGGTVTAANAPGTGGEIVIRGGSSTYRITVNGITGKLSVEDISNGELEVHIGGSGG